MNYSKNKSIKWKWTNLKRILTLLCKKRWIVSKLRVQQYRFILNSVYLCEPFSFRYVWYKADNMNRCRKEPLIWKSLNCQAVRWGLLAVHEGLNGTRYFNWKLNIHHVYPQTELDCYLRSTLWSDNLSLLHSPHTNNPQYNTCMPAVTVSVQSWNSKKYSSIKGYCNILLTVPNLKHKLCYLQSYKEWTHTTDLSECE